MSNLYNLYEIDRVFHLNQAQTLVVIQAMVTTLTSEGGTLSVFLVVASLFGLV